MRKTMIAGVAAAVTMPLLAGTAVAGQPDGAKAVSLKVATYNIQGGLAEGASKPDIKATADAIRSLGADVVTLQEVHQGGKDGKQVDELAKRLGMHISKQTHFGPSDYYDKPSGKAGNVVLSKYEIVERVNYRLKDDPNTKNVKRAMAGVKLDVHGTDVRVYTAHLTQPANDAYRKERDAQMRDALGKIKNVGGPVVLTGDFNARPTEAVIKWAAQAGFTDTWKSTGGNKGDACSGSDERGCTHTASKPKHRIDYVFAKGIKATGAKVPRVTASDHLPVLVALRG